MSKRLRTTKATATTNHDCEDNLNAPDGDVRLPTHFSPTSRASCNGLSKANSKAITAAGSQRVRGRGIQQKPLSKRSSSRGKQMKLQWPSRPPSTDNCWLVKQPSGEKSQQLCAASDSSDAESVGELAKKKLAEKRERAPHGRKILEQSSSCNDASEVAVGSLHAADRKRVAQPKARRACELEVSDKRWTDDGLQQTSPPLPPREDIVLKLRVNGSDECCPRKGCLSSGQDPRVLSSKGRLTDSAFLFCAQISLDGKPTLDERTQVAVDGTAADDCGSGGTSPFSDSFELSSEDLLAMESVADPRSQQSSDVAAVQSSDDERQLGAAVGCDCPLGSRAGSGVDVGACVHGLAAGHKDIATACCGRGRLECDSECVTKTCATDCSFKHPLLQPRSASLCLSEASAHSGMHSECESSMPDVDITTCSSGHKKNILSELDSTASKVQVKPNVSCRPGYQTPRSDLGGGCAASNNIDACIGSAKHWHAFAPSDDKSSEGSCCDAGRETERRRHRRAQQQQRMQQMVESVVNDQLALDGDADSDYDVSFAEERERNFTMTAEVASVGDVTELNDEQLGWLLRKNRSYLRQIVKGKRPCWRHNDYKKGGFSRRNLDRKVRLLMFGEEQVERVCDELRLTFCNKTSKNLDYVLKVLLPEIFIKIYMDIHATSHCETEDIFEKFRLF